MRGRGKRNLSDLGIPYTEALQGYQGSVEKSWAREEAAKAILALCFRGKNGYGSDLPKL